MSDGKGGGIFAVGAFVIIASALSSNSNKEPTQPEICQVPLADGGSIGVPVTSIPCNEMVKNAEIAMREARNIYIPPTLKIELPADSSDAAGAAVAPSNAISEDEFRKFNEPYSTEQKTSEATIVEESENE